MIIKRTALQAALYASSTEYTRYNLNGVQADPAKHAIIATNGHVLLVVTDNHPEADTEFPAIDSAPYHADPAPILLPREACNALLKVIPKKATIPILMSCQLSTNGTEESATLAATDLVSRNVVKINRGSRFPDWERVLPKADREQITVCLGVPVLEALIKAARTAQPKPTANGPFITLTIPVERRGDELKATGEVTTALGISIKGDDLTITGCAMPGRI